MGFALGLLTLRMQGIFFSIATIASTDHHRDDDHELALCPAALPASRYKRPEVDAAFR
jgi:hypothetical protein